ncbi:MAG: hypothetical protein ACI4KH_02115 [Oscillospiraceae bacterium]
MKKYMPFMMFIVSLVMIISMSGCVAENTSNNRIDIQHTEEQTAIQTEGTTVAKTTTDVKTTTEVNLPVSFEEVVKAELEQNPDIIGGMFADLNSDGVDEVIFSVDTPMGIMYTINYFVNNELIKTGEIYYFGYWMNEDEINPEIRVYSDNGISFYCAEKTYSIKDVASINGVEITTYYQMGGAPLPCEVNILTYNNADCSDEVIAEMNKIFNCAKEKIEKCELIKVYPIEMQWSRSDYLK